jgi:hypothetical protein
MSNLLVFSAISTILRHVPGSCDIAVLFGFVAAAEHDNHCLPLPDKVDPASGALVNPHLTHAFTHGFHIADVAAFHSPDAGRYPGAGVVAAKRFKPILEPVGLADLYHL